MSQKTASPARAAAARSPARSRTANRIPDTVTNAEDSRCCRYMHRICLQNRLDGYDFCIRHILFDRNAPFKQCSYVHPQSNKRCPNAARRTERKDSTLCPWHIKKLCLKRKQAGNLSHRIRDTTGTKSVARLLRDLEHYCPEEHEKRRRGHLWTKQEDDTTIATEELRQRIAEAAANMPDSDTEPAVEQTLRGDVVDSDSDSSDGDDPLRHAGVFAAEEVSSILSDKMHRLQNLYIEQFRHLKFLLRDKYRTFCIDTLLDKDCLAPDQLSEVDAEQLRALRKYHKYRGREALLKQQAKQKRRALTDGNQPLTVPICIFEKDDIKCSIRSLPATHYCSKHILYDQNQVLFRPCAAGTQPCLNPVISFRHNNTCIVHKDLKTDLTQAKSVAGGITQEESAVSSAAAQEPELMFQTIDDITSLALDAVVPSALYGLDQFGDLGAPDLLQ